MIWRWLTSGTVRHACEMRRQVRRLISEQKDLLDPSRCLELQSAVEAFDREIATLPLKQIEPAMQRLEAIANSVLKPFPGGQMREQIREIGLAVTVILAFTTFFLQLTKIPTGSMQPTLFGITHQDLRSDRPSVEVPSWFGRIKEFIVSGSCYYHLVAPTDGEITSVSAPRTVFPFIKIQTVSFANQSLRLWFVPDDLDKRAMLHPGQFYHKGEDIVKLKLNSGDHLLVDRLTYNFRRPERGEIFVFKTRGIPDLPQDQLYIKRLVGLPGEKLRIGNDRHLVVDGRRLDASIRHFESVYTFSTPGTQNPYLGHINNQVATQYKRFGLAPLFENQTVEFRVGTDRYMAMGDNTLNSYDSRGWGDVPQANVIGKCWFVYWPLTDRFGWGYR